MANINDHLINLSNNYGSDDSSPLVREEIPSSLDSYHLVTNKSVPKVIVIPDDSGSEKFSSGSLGM